MSYVLMVHHCHNVHFDLTSKLIEKVQDADYSHMAIEFQSETGRQLIVDATRKNISTYARKTFFGDHYISRRSFAIKIDGDRVDFLRWLEPHLGKDYPEEQIVGLALKVLVGYVPNWLISNGSKKMTCNELVTRMLIDLKGVNFPEELMDNIDLNDTTELLKKVAYL